MNAGLRKRSMPIKSTVGECTVRTQAYPKIMRNTKNDLVVLMNHSGIGMVIATGSLHLPIGYYSDGWEIQFFVDYNKPITLENV